MREETPFLIACSITVGVAVGLVANQLTDWGVPHWCAFVAVFGAYSMGVLMSAMVAAFDDAEDGDA